MAGESQEPELEAPEDITRTVRKQGELNTGSQPTFSFSLSLRHQPLNGAARTPGGPSRLSFPTWKSPYRYTRRFVSKVTWNPVHLTININHHAVIDLLLGTEHMFCVKAVSSVAGLC